MNSPITEFLMFMFNTHIHTYTYIGEYKLHTHYIHSVTCIHIYITLYNKECRRRIHKVSTKIVAVSISLFPITGSNACSLLFESV